jgi:hypothetical protein
MSRTQLRSAFERRLSQISEHLIIAGIIVTVGVFDVVATWLFFAE